MDTLTAARIQMELSLAFHMVFAAAGVALPVMMLVAEGRALRNGDETYRKLAQTWGKATGLLFAVGAISGTALSFELGLLWPRFMAFSGALVGGAFALEAYAFFIEAIFLGLYLYGWDRLRPTVHWWCGVPVAVAGAASAVLVVSANAWMQHPTGFDLVDGQPHNVDPVASLFNPAWSMMAWHSTIACYAAVGFASAGVYAWALQHNRQSERQTYNRHALAISMLLGTIASATQPLTGDLLARQAQRLQPAKLAAMEAQFTTQRGAPLRIGGWPDPDARETHWAIEIPGLLSLLATESPDGEVLGLDAFPRDQWPETRVVHPAFQIMVAAGFLLVGVSVWYWLVRWCDRHGNWTQRRRLLRAIVVSSPLGFVALEAGWVVTEVGRQPWVVYGIMRTSEAVTPASGVSLSLAGFTVLYLVLTFSLILLLRRMAGSSVGAVTSTSPGST